MATTRTLRAGAETRNGNGASPPSLAALQGLMRPRDEPDERCDLCGAPLAPHPRHEHLYEPEVRQLSCSCTACALLFPPEAEKRYRRVGRRLWHLRDFVMTDAQWEAMALPVNMAFLHTSAPSGSVHAFYPSPAGPVASLLTLEGWSDLVTANPVLGAMQPDIEALLINRVRDAREHYIAPIDRCYELVGHVRSTWRGLSGGQEVWERIGAFFEALRAQSTERAAGDA